MSNTNGGTGKDDGSMVDGEINEELGDAGVLPIPDDDESDGPDLATEGSAPDAGPAKD